MCRAPSYWCQWEQPVVNPSETGRGETCWERAVKRCLHFCCCMFWWLFSLRRPKEQRDIVPLWAGKAPGSSTREREGFYGSQQQHCFLFI